MIELVLAKLCRQVSFLYRLCELGVVRKLLGCLWISPQIMIIVEFRLIQHNVDQVSIGEIALVIELKYTSIDERRALSIEQKSC